MAWTIIEEFTDTKGFQFQTTLFEGFKIEQLRSPLASSSAEFLPVKVVFDNKEVWSFKNDHKKRGFAGMAFLREYDDELFIILATRWTLCEVLPIRDLPHLQRINEKLIGGRKLKDLIELKSLLAEKEGLEPFWSQRESALKEATIKATASAQQAAKLEVEMVAEQKRSERRAARNEKRAEILSRQRIFAHTLSGDRRHGYPVVDTEWMILRDGTFCISVTTYNTTTGEVGELIESFIVKKNGGKTARHAISVVTKEHPVKKNTAPQTISFVTVPIKGEVEEVILTQDMDSIRALRDQGLNSGTLAMCPKAGDNGRFAVFSIIEGRIEPVTEVMLKK